MPNTAAIQAAWTTAKAQLATVQADANTLANDLAALEASCDTLYNLMVRTLVPASFRFQALSADASPDSELRRKEKRIGPVNPTREDYECLRKTQDEK
jgi:hypothetical protein